MNTGASFDLMRDLVDHELQDCDGVACGMVDDVELEGEQSPRIVALLVGPGAWQWRLPALARLCVRALAGTKRVRVPFAEVGAISEVIRLRSTASHLGLGVVDRRVARWLSKVAHD
jgi:sporulation protein YlmC with PRC-barrel domain